MTWEESTFKFQKFFLFAFQSEILGLGVFDFCVWTITNKSENSSCMF